MHKRLKKINLAGFVVSGPSGNGSFEGPIEILFAGAVGALLGFVGGMLVGVIARICTLNRLRGIIGGKHWAAYGAGAGALGLALIEIFD
jgi:hypothetical protein